MATMLALAAGGALAQPTDEDQDTHILNAMMPPATETPLAPAASPASDPAHFLLFSTTDLWHQGGFAYGGVLWAPSGLDQNGPVVKLIFGGGLYQYTSGALGNATVVGRELTASVLPGWRFVRDNIAVTLFVGYDFQQHRLFPDDPSAGLRGSYHGARAGFEVWYQPLPWAMIAADASISSIGPSYNVRLATGVRAFDMFYVGPEVQTFGADHNYQQFRAGLHVTGFRTGQFEWAAAGGWARDSDDHSGAYGRLGILTRR